MKIFICLIFALLPIVSSAQALSPTGQLLVNYSSTNVGTSSFVQVMASTPITSYVDIFDSSGQILELVQSAGTTPIVVTYIYPGGNGKIPVYISSGVTLSLKSLTSTASTGYIVINFFN